MSGDSSNAVLKSNKDKNSDQSANLDVRKKKEKKNFCYVCKIQCSGNRNFEQHNKGRKHLRKMGADVNVRKKTKVKTVKNNSVKDKSKQNEPVELNPEVETKDNYMETTESRRNHNKSGEKSFSKLRNCQTKNNMQPPKNFYKNHRRNQDYYHYYTDSQNPYYYDKRQYPYHMHQYNYPRWNYPINIENRQWGPTSNFLNAVPPGSLANSLYNPEYCFQPDYNAGEDVAQQSQPEMSQISPNIKNAIQSEPSSTSNETSVTADNIVNSISSLLAESRENVEQPATKEEGADCHAAQEDYLSDDLISRMKKRSRSRSIDDGSCFNDKRKNGDEEMPQEDVDSEADQQKIKNWTNTLLETNHGQISRLIHPSNYKDLAAVNQLITNLSKSKRKENLSRLKFRSDSLCSSGTNEDDDRDTAEEESVESRHSSEIASTVENSEVAEGDQCSVRKSKKATAARCFESAEKAYSDSDRTPDQIEKSVEKRRKLDSSQLRQQASISNHLHRKEKVTTNNVSHDNQVKRSFDAVDNKTKKQKCSDSIHQPVITLETSESSNLPATENSTSTADVTKDSSECLKEEVQETTDSNLSVTCPIFNTPQTTGSSSEFSVDTLISLFATGSVKVKNEFNDPAIDAIKSVDPAVLMNACSANLPFAHGNSAERQTSVDSPTTSRLTVPEASPNDAVEMENRNCLSPLTLDSSVMNDNLSNLQTDQTPSECSFSGIEGIQFMPKDKSEYTPELKKLIKELQKISSQEETVKQNLGKAKSKINDYQTLLLEWKSKRSKLYEKEENLRKKRNDIIELMQNAIKATSDLRKEKENAPSSSKVQHFVSDCSENLEPENRREKSNYFPKARTPKSKQKSKEMPSLGSEEIAIIPVPVKTEPPEVIVIDDDTLQNGVHANGLRDSTASIGSSVPSLYDMKSLTVHTTVVNGLLVFEDYVYTCSNDSTARRFSIKNPSSIVTYQHAAKNVSEITVEKVQNEALVFTSCTNRVISLFIAANGTKIKTFVQSCAILSICNGWGKFYSGMADGTIYVYNWRYEEKEVVKMDHPASRISTAHQGRLHVLIILTSNGNISIRDAETGLLIRYVKGFVKLPSWLTVHNDLAYLSSSDKTLTILDILTGRAEKKLYVSSHTTGLSVYDDYIFTISYTGLVNCYNKEKASERKLYYGAGKNGLTCIYVYQDWVFTGNRKGEVSVFHFDSTSAATCQFGQCSWIFGLKEDLAYHVERDHLSKKRTSRCLWGICTYPFPAFWNSQDKMKHMDKHIYQNVINCLS